MESTNRPSRTARDLLSIGLAAALTLMARSSLADHYTVPSGSMRPTVEVGDRIVVHKAAYGLRLPGADAWLTEVEVPARGDVVVLRSPEDDRVLLKRVVAVAGDEVEVRRGRVFVDAREERPLVGRLRGAGPDFGPQRVPAGELLVMGDNRGNSHDGRSFGFVRAEAVLGRALGVYWRDGGPTWQPLR